MKYEELVDYAEGLIKLENKRYKEGNYMGYVCILSGMGPGKVESFEGAGHNYQAVVDAINRVYKNDNDSQANSALCDALKCIIKMSNSVSNIQNVFNILFYQKKLEKENNSSFFLETEDIMARINAKLQEKYDSFATESISFEDWLIENAQYAKENYGLDMWTKG